MYTCYHFVHVSDTTRDMCFVWLHSIQLRFQKVGSTLISLEE